MTTEICAKHGTPIVDEPGGKDMPTLFGRRYCPACQREMNRLSELVEQSGRTVRAEAERDALRTENARLLAALIEVSQMDNHSDPLGVARKIALAALYGPT